MFRQTVNRFRAACLRGACAAQLCLLSLRENRDGQAMVEYGLILALIAVAVIAVVTLLGGQIKNMFGSISNAL